MGWKSDSAWYRQPRTEEQMSDKPTMRPCATFPIADNHSEHQQQMPNLALSYWLVPGAS
jgi:hypothetical protein